MTDKPQDKQRCGGTGQIRANLFPGDWVRDPCPGCPDCNIVTGKPPTTPCDCGPGRIFIDGTYAGCITCGKNIPSESLEKLKPQPPGDMKPSVSKPPEGAIGEALEGLDLLLKRGGDLIDDYYPAPQLRHIFIDCKAHLQTVREWVEWNKLWYERGKAEYEYELEKQDAEIATLREGNDQLVGDLRKICDEKDAEIARLRGEVEEIVELAGHGGDGTAFGCVESLLVDRETFRQERDFLRSALEEARGLLSNIRFKEPEIAAAFLAASREVIDKAIVGERVDWRKALSTPPDTPVSPSGIPTANRSPCFYEDPLVEHKREVCKTCGGGGMTHGCPECGWICPAGCKPYKQTPEGKGGGG